MKFDAETNSIHIYLCTITLSRVRIEIVVSKTVRWNWYIHGNLDKMRRRRRKKNGKYYGWTVNIMRRVYVRLYAVWDIVPIGKICSHEHWQIWRNF